jgi:cation diffusion facilitator CzcD-associated flavoprotein CzcO
MSERDAVVVGAGPAGVGTALALKDRGVTALVLDRADEVAASWRGRYDRLRLNSSRPLSHLPGRRYPKGTPIFPTRENMIEYVDRHAREGGIDLRLGTNVDRIEPENGGWVLRTSGGDVTATQVVVATGYEHTPFIPEWEGRSAFAGELTHAAGYRNPKPYEGKRVLVVGSGCTGMEIAHDLAEGGAEKVWLAVRTPPNIVLRQGPGPLPGDFIAVPLLHAPVRFADAFARFGSRMDVGDLSEYGLPVPEEGIFSRMRRLGVAPAIVDEPVIESIKSGAVEVVRGVESLDREGVVLADGARVEPDAVICATGYRRGLEPLVGHLDVLDERGVPKALGPEPAAPGLRFLGYVPRPAAIRHTGKMAVRAAREIARELRAA